MDVLGLSQRRACLIVGVARSSFQRAHKHAKDVVTFDKYAELRQWLHTWAAQNPRWGYRRAWIKTKEEGFDVGRDVVRRVWRQENLRVPSRKRSKPKTLADPTPRVEPAACPNDVWALDFQFDSDYHGRSIKVCNVMDEFTREHVGFTADSTIDAAAVVELLDVIACERGQRPRVVRMDNGPEFISKTLQSWAAEEETVQAFIPPGQPWNNGFVESLHNRMRDELFEQECFLDLEHVRYCIGQWCHRYNTYHPHSALGFIPPEEFKKQFLSKIA